MIRLKVPMADQEINAILIYTAGQEKKKKRKERKIFHPKSGLRWLTDVPRAYSERKKETHPSRDRVSALLVRVYVVTFPERCTRARQGPTSTRVSA